MAISLEFWEMATLRIGGKEKRVPSNHPDFATCTSLQQAHVKFSERQARSKWGADRGPLALALPSVIVPEWNVVLFPNHPEFSSG